MKSYTDIEQSKKLAEILPMESADQTWERIAIAGDNLDVPEEMEYWHNGNVPCILNSKIGIPCWSLAALLALLPLPTLEETLITDTETKWQCTIYCDKAKYWSELHDEPIDALIEAILIAKENNN